MIKIVRQIARFDKHITVDLHKTLGKISPFVCNIMIAMNAILMIPLLLGWVAGLLVNYLSDVLPVTRRFSQPACPNCRAPYRWIEYLTFRACSSCGRKRSLRTWLVLILGVASYLYFWLSPPKALGFALAAILLVYFGLITVIDLEHRLILHPTSLVGAVLGLGIGTFVQNKIHQGWIQGLGYSILGGIVGFGILLILYQFGALVTRMRARRMRTAGQTTDDEEALGGGDVYLAGVLGLLLGWPFILNGILLAVLIGGAVSILFLIALLVRRRYSSEALMTFIPYGPYFVLSAFILLYL